MRKARTPEEDKCIESLVKKLMSHGRSVDLSDDVIDQPDALMHVDGKAIAVECTIISPQRLLQSMRHKFEGEYITMAVLPLEPHMWIKQAIEEKAKKEPQYRENVAAAETWLVCHTGYAHTTKVPELEANYFLVGYAYGVYLSENPFSRVFLVDEREERVITLFKDGKYCIADIQEQDFPGERLPCGISFFGPAVVKDLGEGKAGLSINLNEPNQRLILPILDQRYELNESEILSLDFSNIGNGNSYPQIFARRK